MTDKEFFNALVEQELAMMEAKEVVKGLVEQAKESGIEKEEIVLIKKAAKLHAAAKYEETKAANEALAETYERLTS